VDVVSTCPVAAVPEIAGRDVFAGPAAAAIVVGPNAVASTRPTVMATRRLATVPVTTALHEKGRKDRPSVTIAHPCGSPYDALRASRPK